MTASSPPCGAAIPRCVYAMNSRIQSGPSIRHQDSSLPLHRRCFTKCKTCPRYLQLVVSQAWDSLLDSWDLVVHVAQTYPSSTWGPPSSPVSGRFWPFRRRVYPAVLRFLVRRISCG
ncbi:hypothetical protein PUNSTDRAFT_118777 [Punctularia strigosozonata HHB-11173 SS5]|uniref:uncharacterized protein n=1 Tax=Punctularia strigosozonata (strain HHB-11173) TaxID=741275 RepID=UPI0004417C9C|nr:uncharacterized protein PUNSTDRAFT_118777 [Punctularia strigosozonata HHB-11173 SS5]EIN11310.1 hypothetical protein PUNSTDRAFT_118777 [Punctularia strigosozonata HHB-11173 SS5]